MIESQKPEKACDQGSSCGGSFTIYGECEHMTKSFLSFEDQINKLQNEKGLIINDHLYAEKMLREIGYF